MGIIANEPGKVFVNGEYAGEAQYWQTYKTLPPAWSAYLFRNSRCSLPFFYRWPRNIGSQIRMRAELSETVANFVRP